MPGNILFFIFSLIAVWMGAGIIVTSLDRISRRLEISAFAASFYDGGLRRVFRLSLSYLVGNDLQTAFQ